MVMGPFWVDSVGESGISKIYYINDYKNDELVEVFCKEKNVDIIKI